MTITTCKDCQKRHRACWDTCPEYKEARKDFEEKRNAMQKDWLDNQAIGAAQYHGLKRKNKRR